VRIRYVFKNYSELRKGPYKREFGARVFRGAVIDTGAPHSVIGRAEAILYCAHLGIPFSPRLPSPRQFKFGNTLCHSLGRLRVMLPFPHIPIAIDVDVVALDIPLLIGKSLLEKHDLIVDVKRKRLISPHGNILLHDDGHLLIEWEPRQALHTFYTPAEIRNLHRHYLHPSAKRLYDILKRADPNLSSATKDLVKDVTEACSSCAEFSRKPISFSVRTPDDIIFNQELLLDLMYIGHRPILHIIDRGTRFSAARFLPRADAQTVWTTFVRAWSTLYVGFPESILTDQGSIFLSHTWQGMCRAAEIDLRHTGVESHNSLHAGESLHAPLRKIFLRVRDSHPGLTDEMCLALSVQAMNDNFNADGLCPTLLVFGVRPKFPRVPFLRPANVERFHAMATARKEYGEMVAHERNRRAISKRPPPEHLIVPGDMVYVYREGPRKWIGPVLCLHRDEKHVLVAMGTGAPVEFNITQIKPAPIVDPSPTGYSKSTPFVCITEIVPAGDPREYRFGPAIKQEILGLIERGTFELVIASEDTKNINILPSRFVFAIKRSEDGKERLKARLWSVVIEIA
jgi:transposase InsO family protein